MCFRGSDIGRWSSASHILGSLGMVGTHLELNPSLSGNLNDNRINIKSKISFLNDVLIERNEPRRIPLGKTNTVDSLN